MSLTGLLSEIRKQRCYYMSSFRTGSLTVHVHANVAEMASAAAEASAKIIANAIQSRGSARIILATAVSQVEFFHCLVENPQIDWSRVTVFHLDEFLGITENSPSSFGYFLTKQLLSKVTVGAAYKINGSSLLPLEECARYEALLKEKPIDLCCAGVGENGHIAFNDPDVADFEEKSWVKLVKLDERCREQQVKDEVFPTLKDVPLYAYTLTIPALCHSLNIVGVVPGRHKAEAVAKMLQGDISTSCPASVLRRHPKALLYLDANAAERLLIA